LTDAPLSQQLAINDYCHKKGIAFLSADTFGAFAWAFADFGDAFVVHDKDGEEPEDILVGNVSKDQQGMRFSFSVALFCNFIIIGVFYYYYYYFYFFVFFLLLLLFFFIYVIHYTDPNTGVVTTLDKQLHGLEDGDTVQFKEVQGMTELNDKSFQVSSKSPNEFYIGDTSNFSAYIRGGTARKTKTKSTMRFVCITHCFFPFLFEYVNS
jgi:hypothetical protein